MEYIMDLIYIAQPSRRLLSPKLDCTFFTSMNFYLVTFLYFDLGTFMVVQLDGCFTNAKLLPLTVCDQSTE